MTTAAMTFGLLRQYQRNIFLLLLLVTVPFIFITLSFYITESEPIEIFVTESGSRVALTRMMPEVHAAIMVPITVSFLAGIVGLFVMLDASKNDSRLLVAGLPAVVVASSRLVIMLALSLVITIVSISVTLMNFSPGDLAGFLAGNLLIGISYAFIGAVAALVVGRLGGAYLMFFVPMVDVGIFQDPMFVSGDQALWMKLLPGFGGTRMVIDAGFSGAMDDWTALVAGLAWAVALGALACGLFVVKPTEA
jgi:hypothetical protein